MSTISISQATVVAHASLIATDAAISSPKGAVPQPAYQPVNDIPVVEEKNDKAVLNPEYTWEFLVDKKTGKRVMIHGKPVILWSGKTVLNMTSGFEHKYLCTGPIFNMGDACAYSCPFCYVQAATHGRFKAFLEKEGLAFEDVVIRRKDALEVLKKQLKKLSAKKRNFPHVAYSSTNVDVAATVELVKETAEACILIFKMTKWEIRLLSKSNMLPLLVSKIPKKYHHRLILGVSTGTFDDELAQAVETGTPLVSKRIESLYKLQDDGLRTYAMVCPSMPMKSVEEYEAFAQLAAKLLRYDRMEHVWAEVMNIRGTVRLEHLLRKRAVDKSEIIIEF